MIANGGEREKLVGTRNGKVASSKPGRSGAGEFSSPELNLCADLFSVRSYHVLPQWVPAGSPSRSGDVMVYVTDLN